MTERHFDTPRPIDLRIEIRRGRIRVHATETDTTRVIVTSVDSEADEVAVEQRGDAISVLAPGRTGLLNRDPHYDVQVEVPVTSRLTARTGSADIEATGRYGEVQLEAGSGDVRVAEVDGEAHVKTGSGDLTVDRVAAGGTLKTGSGDIRLADVGGRLVASTGSGDLTVGRCEAALTLKTGSGDIQIAESDHAVTASTGSGSVSVDLARSGLVEVKGASGDVRIGVPAGTPVWTDIVTASGRVHSDLDGVGAPAEGQDHLEVRARTASGDVTLLQR